MFAHIAKTYLDVKLVPAKSVSTDYMVSLIAKGIDLSEDLNYSCDAYYPEKENLSVDSEQGDDHVVLTQKPQVPLMESTIACQIFGMEMSLPDTFFSKTYCTYTGKVAIMPLDHFDHYSQTLLKGKDKQSILIDLPPLRSVVDVSSQVKMNTSSLEGRMNMIARSVDYNRGTNEEKLLWTISILQDVTHCVLTKGDKFPYVPSYLGGYDKTPPFNCEENLERALFAFKRGRYKNLVYTILNQFYSLLYKENVPSKFLQRIKGMYSGYQSWYCNYKRNFPLFSGKLPPEMQKYRIQPAVENFSIQNMVIRRLEHEGIIVKEKELIVASEIQDYFKSLIVEDLSAFKNAKEEREEQFRSQSRIQQAFEELVQGQFDVIISNQLEPGVLEWARDIRISDSRLYKNAFIGDEYFWRTALDEIYLKSPLKIEFPLIGEKFKIVKQKDLRPGIELLDDEDRESVNELVRWMKGDLSKFPFPPRELLEDDEILLEKIKYTKNKFLEKGAFPVSLIITNDEALCKLVNTSTSVPVIRLPPELIFLKRTGRYNVEKTEEPLKFFINQLNRFVPGVTQSISVIEHDSVIFPDYGSWDAAMIKWDLSPYQRITQTEIRSDQIFEYRKLESISPVTSLLDVLQSWPNGFIYDNEVLIQRKEFSASENWRVKSKAERPGFNPMSFFNRGRRNQKHNPQLVHALKEGLQESVLSSTELERKNLFQYE